MAPKRGTALKSKAQIASTLRISRKSLYLRMKVQPEFAEAMEEAQFAALAWWENMGQAGPKLGSKFNASLYTYEMKNRLREFYTDKVELAHTATATSEPEVPEMSDVELARRVAFMVREAMLKPGSSGAMHTTGVVGH